VAAELKARSLARGTPVDPLLIYATVGEGAYSPDHATFLDLVRARNLSDAVEIVENVQDTDVMFRRLRVMLVPSNKEAASYSAMEAMSYGVPVIAASYAPGPAQLIDDGHTGFLVDEWTGAAVVDRLEELTGPRLAAMSRAAFEEHTRHAIDPFMDVLERVAKQALAVHAAAGGRNVVRPFPNMRRLGRKGC
jgi:glycosyltransferase involved in cell wall biosynthesis